MLFTSLYFKFMNLNQENFQLLLLIYKYESKYLNLNIINSPLISCIIHFFALPL